MKKYALVGTGGRAGMYIAAIGGQWKETATLVAFCDTNHTRMQYANQAAEEGRWRTGLHLARFAV